MLKSVPLRTGEFRDPITIALASGVGGEDRITELKPGVYLMPHFSLEYEVLLPQESIEIWPDFGAGFDCYGVCDNLEQILAAYDFDSDARWLFMGLTAIHKDEQPAQGGWRWHKWGRYIGTQNPQFEYIYDEPAIERVFVYHVYEIKGQ